MTAEYHKYIEGERVYLREVRSSDVNEAYYRWMNDPEVIQHLETRFTPQSMESIRTYVERLNGSAVEIFLAICLREGDRHIGNIKLGPISAVHRSANISLLIGEKDCWGQGYAAEAIRLVTEYAFQTLNLHRVSAGCYANNQGSLKAFQKAGFEQEGVLREAYFSDGSYQNGLLVARLRD